MSKRNQAKALKRIRSSKAPRAYEVKTRENPAAREHLNSRLDLIQSEPEGPELLMAHLAQVYRSGRRKALADAIYYSAHLDRPLPHWAAEAFASGYQRLQRREVDSWDTLLGKPPHKRSAAPRANAYSIYRRCRELIDSGDHHTNADLFDIVAQEFKIEKTLCSDLYYMVKPIEEKIEEGLEQERSEELPPGSGPVPPKS
jgi:hypothetical protein